MPRQARGEPAPGTSRGREGHPWRSFRLVARAERLPAATFLLAAASALGALFLSSARGPVTDLEALPRPPLGHARRLQGNCSAQGSPLHGVLYVPHMVGEPFPLPDSTPEGYYGEHYSSFHERDLPLISRALGADTALLRPWAFRDTSTMDFFNTRLSSAGICRVIPTFHLSKYYTDLLKSGDQQPATDANSPLFENFVQFGRAMASLDKNVEVAAWSVDLSLDLEPLLLEKIDQTCQVEPTKGPNFLRYKRFLEVLVNWVQQPASAARTLKEQSVPFLVPLDVSRLSFTRPHFEKQLTGFLHCMGVWSPTLFGGRNPTKWLLSFALPYQDGYNLTHWLSSLSSTLERRGTHAVVMVGTQALRSDPNNVNDLVDDFGNGTSPAQQQYILQRAFDEYTSVRSEHGNLDGFILDEWQDDWDRGSRGPFFLAQDNVELMHDACTRGGRFSHDILRCARKVGNGWVYPEFFGMAGTDSQALSHCIAPRFDGLHFRFPGGNASVGESEGISVQCRLFRPSILVITCAAGVLLLIGTIQGLSVCLGLCCAHKAAESQQFSHLQESHDRTVGYVTITPHTEGLQGKHVIELSSNRLRSNEEAGWWLWTHLSCQMTILEKQVMAEVSARQALRSRQAYICASQKPGSALATPRPELEDSSDDLGVAVATVHRRVLEGFAAWCLYVAGAPLKTPSGVRKEVLREFARMIDDNKGRSTPRLFAEALLLRVMESLGEHILQCPERLSFLLYQILSEAGGAEYSDTPTTFSIDFDELQCGLEEMHFHSNPYVRKRMPNGKSQRGLNFDDINECGIQCRPGLAKTYKEPSSIVVVLEFFLCYRGPFMIKMWTVFIAGYIYLGSGLGNDITTAGNGPWYRPRWLRINFIQYTAMGDAAMWVLIELILIVYVLWKRWPSLSRRSPGVPNLLWFLTHFFNLAFSGIGFCGILRFSVFKRKPLSCRGGDSAECEEDFDDLDNLLLCAAGIYWVSRIVIFFFMHKRHSPIFLHGTPGKGTRKDAGRTFFSSLKGEIAVDIVWVLMLAACVFLEVFMLLPSLQGVNLTSACGLGTFGNITGLPHNEVGACSQADHMLFFGCASCISSVFLAWLLVALGCTVDIYFVFYAFSSIFGYIMGHGRHLNDVKNTSVPVDLRPAVGREAMLFEHTFGPSWQQVWLAMARSLFSEAYISPKHYSALVEAAGLTEDGQELTARRDKKMRPIQLSRFPRIAAERMAFFFQSLEWIEKPSGPARGMHFESDTDALTGTHFNPGTVPTLTQIIPCYNEVVIPSAEYLRSGGLPEDAMNQSPEGQPGVGDVTDPPKGDGVNTNLGFMISQFPDEWNYLAEYLRNEGQLGALDAHDLYKQFMQNSLDLREELVVEVRLWAALRSQSVAKTIIGALQYQRALGMLPRIREYYASRPGKRMPEDHAEVILAHQTYGMNPPEGSWENDEAVRLLLMRYASDSLVLVFDLTRRSNDTVWALVEAFLKRRGGYEAGAFECASVKCKWDPALRDLRVLEVLPRKFPLRIGQGEYKTQGKAGNQLNALRFATGHYLQALDCNMGCFIGEGFKVPYALRVFMPLDKSDRVATRCRYLGFREHIFTGREGTIGKCHASAEWTFGTIYQRFLSGLGARMHYGHPDFVDGFWARNRGGMSKSSAVVNLSEDIFAGYNVRMREEASPHIDALEFEKGRESTFNAASNFFAKISAGSVAVMRSRDNFLLCERIGILHSLSFYFVSVAFYVSNYVVDLCIQLYVVLFIAFTLANIDLGRLHRLGSSFSTEWIVSMGIVSLVPQVFEQVLEYGAIHAIKDAVGGFFAATWFFVFQNKTISSAMRNGALTGIAKYLSTGRPIANQHQTWRDAFVTYSKSHYQPAFFLLSAYLVYQVLVDSSFEGRLPMLLIALSFISWLITPIVFNPFPRWSLIKQDMQEFHVFINGRAGMDKLDLADVVDRGQKSKVRTLFEFGLADEITSWSELPVFVLLIQVLIRCAVAVLLALMVPSEIMDFLWIYVVTLSAQWLLVFSFFTFEQSNILLILSFLIWPLALVAGSWVIGHRARSPSTLDRLPEYFISLLVFLYLLGLAKRCVLITTRLLFCFRHRCSRAQEQELRTRLHESIRLAYVYFFVHQLHCVQAYIVLLVNFLTSLALALIDSFPWHVHTWWLLNGQAAKTSKGGHGLDFDSQSSASSTTGDNSDASSDTSSDDTGTTFQSRQSGSRLMGNYTLVANR